MLEGAPVLSLRVKVLKCFVEMSNTQAGLLETVKSTLDRLLLQVRIVLALSETEFVLRAEKGSFGVWGVLLEPFALLITLLALRILVRLKTTDLLDPVTWLSCGIILLYMFRKIGINALKGVSKRQKFFFYRRIRPLDTLLASALIEARIHGSILVFVFAGVSFWNWQIKLDQPALALVDFLLTISLGLGVGISALVVGHRIPIVKTLTKFGINRIILWTSGIFYATYTLPGPVRPFVTWNPLLHSVELLRHSINVAYPIPGISLQYLIVCSSLSCGFGLLFYFLNEALLLADD
jgi:capsular polysaccharide transport system permease protein|tara:strand:+ start:197 stop:1078 length:882 start_codon:yes stop_codon:yes gene_type:complete